MNAEDCRFELLSSAFVHDDGTEDEAPDKKEKDDDDDDDDDNDDDDNDGDDGDDNDDDEEEDDDDDEETDSDDDQDKDDGEASASVDRQLEDLSPARIASLYIGDEKWRELCALPISKGEAD